MRAIRTRDLYIFYPLFEGQNVFLRGFFSENYGLMYGLYSRPVSNQERVMMACIWYILFKGGNYSQKYGKLLVYST